MPTDNDLDSLDSISKRLKFIVDTMGVKQSHMAEKLGLSPSGLHYILNNDVKFSKNAKKIAEFLNVNEDWLVKGIGEMYDENISTKTYKVPIYYPDQLKLHYHSNQKEKINPNDFMITTTSYHGRTIATYITETHFSPKFEISDIVLFEQVENIRDGEIVLTYLVKQNIVAIKHYFNAGKEIILVSPNEIPIKIANDPHNLIVIGSYRECLKKYKII